VWVEVKKEKYYFIARLNGGNELVGTGRTAFNALVNLFLGLQKDYEVRGDKAVYIKIDSMVVDCYNEEKVKEWIKYNP